MATFPRQGLQGYDYDALTRNFRRNGSTFRAESSYEYTTRTNAFGTKVPDCEITLGGSFWQSEARSGVRPGI
jgi:hypothetical protein